MREGDVTSRFGRKVKCSRCIKGDRALSAAYWFDSRQSASDYPFFMKS
jgi:hypothetical protein